MSIITYTKDDKVTKRQGEYYEVDSCYTTPRSIIGHQDLEDYRNDPLFAALMGDVDELTNKPRRFFDHLLSILEYKRDHDSNIQKGNHREYWQTLIEGAEQWLSAVNNGLYGCVKELAEPVGIEVTVPARIEVLSKQIQHLRSHDDEKFEELLFELEDAVWCSKVDSADTPLIDDAQRQAATERVEKAKGALRDLRQKEFGHGS